MSTKVRGHEIADVLDKVCEMLNVEPERDNWEGLLERFASWLGNPDIGAVKLARALGPDVPVQDPAVMVSMVAELRARAEQAEVMSTLGPGATPERRLLAKLSDARELIRYMTEQRDAARREVCEALRKQCGCCRTVRYIAVERGWGYLYPEPVAAAEECEECDKDGRAWSVVNGKDGLSLHSEPCPNDACDKRAEPVADVADEHPDFSPEAWLEARPWPRAAASVAPDDGDVLDPEGFGGEGF